MSARPHRVHPLEPTGPLEDLVHRGVTSSLRVLLRTLWRVSTADIPPLGEGPDGAEELQYGLPSDEHHRHFGGGQTEVVLELAE